MHPIAFQLGPITIHWYGVMIALAFLAGLWTATRRARRENIPAEKIADVTLWLMVGAIVGARFVYVATYWREEFASQPLSEVFKIYHGGLVYYGGFIGDLLSGVLYFLTIWLGYSQPDMAGHVHDYGTKFLVAAGLLNLLAMVDAWEIATGKKD